MPKVAESRKARFKAALALANTTVLAWCEEQGISTGHLYQVLNGDRESASLLERVDAYIERYAPAA